MLVADLWRAALDETGASMEELRTKHMPYVMWDVIFNSRFTENPAENNTDSTVSLDPQAPRQEIRFLRIPYRF